MSAGRRWVAFVQIGEEERFTWYCYNAETVEQASRVADVLAEDNEKVLSVLSFKRSE